MEIRKGIAVSPGIAISHPMIMDSKDYRIPRRLILESEKAGEIERVRQAFAHAIKELTEIKSKPEIKDSKIKDIFAVHLSYLRDRSFRKTITDYVSNELTTAEYAVSKILSEIAEHFENLDDEYISARSADIYDIERRLVTYLMGRVHADLKKIDSEVVIIAHDLTPTQTAGFDKKFVKGFAIL